MTTILSIRRPSRPTGLVAAVAIASAIAVTAVATATAAPDAATGAHHGRPSVHLTQADKGRLERLTPRQAARLDTELNKVFERLGISVGLGTPASSHPGATALTAYDWSGGIRWDHVWVTASYADLAGIANNLGLVTAAAGAYCARLGEWAAPCGAVAAVITYLVSKVHVTWNPNHGVWGAYYWFPWTYTTGGYW